MPDPVQERLTALPRPPRRLFMRGTWPSQAPWVTIVGARAATGSGVRFARELAAGLGELGAVVLSGGAIGIDAAAHEGAISAGAPTVAVLGGGLSNPYPSRNRALFDQIVARGGAIVTECSPGTAIRPWGFARRNEILAALADCTIVVEAGLGSGSLITAAAARRMNRLLLAWPKGGPGAAALLAQGAAVVESAEDVLAALAGRVRSIDVAQPQEGSDEALILAALDGGEARGIEKIAELAGLGTPRTARALCALELDGLALPVPGGQYVRSVLGAS